MAQQEMVGHAGNVVTYNDMRRSLVCQERVLFRHALGMFQEEPEQLIECRNGAVAVICDGRVRIEVREKEAFQASVLFGHLWRE